MFEKTKGFSLIELLIVIVLIGVISVIAFVNFGNQTPKARNAMRLDSSSKILTAFQLANLEEKISSTSCLSGSSDYSLEGIVTGTGCNVILDGSQDAKTFLKNLKITGNFQDPLNETKGYDDFIYEFNYKLGSSQQEFVFLTEPTKNTSFLRTYSLNYQSGSLNTLNINGNYPSVDKMISPIIFKDNNGQNLFSSLYRTKLTSNGKIKVTRFEKTTEYKDKLQSFVNKSNSSTNDNSGNTDNQYSLISNLPDFVQIDKDYLTQITLNNGHGGKYSEANVISGNNELKNGFTLYYKENGQYKNLFSHPNIVDVTISPGFVFANNQLGILFRFRPVLSSNLDIYYKISEIENLTQEPSINYLYNGTGIETTNINLFPYSRGTNLKNKNFIIEFDWDNKDIGSFSFEQSGGDFLCPFSKHGQFDRHYCLYLYPGNPPRDDHFGNMFETSGHKKVEFRYTGFGETFGMEEQTCGFLYQIVVNGKNVFSTDSWAGPGHTVPCSGYGDWSAEERIAFISNESNFIAPATGNFTIFGGITGLSGNISNLKSYLE